MTIKVRFENGPLHGKTANVNGLPQCQIFFDQRQRQVYCYNRTDELVYTENLVYSVNLTQIYDQAFAKFGGTEKSIESFDAD